MGTRIFVGKEAGTDLEQALMFDSVTGTVFGPFFDSPEDAEDFVRWCREGEDGEYRGDPATAQVTNPGSPGEDPRRLHHVDLALAVERWQENRA